MRGRERSDDLLDAHDASRCNRAELSRSEVCGCFHCLRIFAPADVHEWCAESDEEGAQDTAICPHCDIDAVLGSASGHDITAELLSRMHDRWFSGTA